MARGVGVGGGGCLREAIIWGMAMIWGNKVTDTLSTTSFKKNPRFHLISHHDDNKLVLLNQLYLEHKLLLQYLLFMFTSFFKPLYILTWNGT